MKRLFVAAVLLLILAAGAYIYWQSANAPVSTADRSNKIFVINRGETVREIGNSLKKEGLIRDPVVFFLFIKLNGQDKKIQAGDYRLSPSMNLSKLIDTLNHGTLDIWVTVPEGMRAEEIADILKKDLPTYDESWRAQLNANEGYLFPDTYLIPRDADADMVISMFRNNFNKKIEGIELSSTSANLPRIVTIASLIEREAITDEEKPLIAGIIDNRLRSGMALDIDATIQFVKGKDGKWWPQITVADYKNVDSPYNTYLQPGLPPGPISNPGIEAIRAAANPQDHSYYFYIHSKGKIYPAKNVDEHNANIRKYL